MEIMDEMTNPDLLIIEAKNANKIENINEFTLNPKISEKNGKSYSLISILCKVKSWTSSNSYYSFSKINGKWFRFEDGISKEEEEENKTLLKDACVLFFVSHQLRGNL